MIYHVATTSDWDSHKDKNHYAPAAFAKEGFIHSCHHNQLDGVLQCYFAGRTDIVLLHIDEQKLMCQLKYEEGTGKELFPHLYGVINKDAIVEVALSF